MNEPDGLTYTIEHCGRLLGLSRGAAYSAAEARFRCCGLVGGWWSRSVLSFAYSIQLARRASNGRWLRRYRLRARGVTGNVTAGIARDLRLSRVTVQQVPRLMEPDMHSGWPVPVHENQGGPEMTIDPQRRVRDLISNHQDNPDIQDRRTPNDSRRQARD
jgi:hypothetical protein